MDERGINLLVGIRRFALRRPMHCNGRIITTRPVGQSAGCRHGGVYSVDDHFRIMNQRVSRINGTETKQGVS